MSVVDQVCVKVYQEGCTRCELNVDQISDKCIKGVSSIKYLSDV